MTFILKCHSRLLNLQQLAVMLSLAMILGCPRTTPSKPWPGQGLDPQGQDQDKDSSLKAKDRSKDENFVFKDNRVSMTIAKDNITGKSTSILSPAHNLQVITIHNYVVWASCARG